MNIDLNKITYYFLTYKNPKREKFIRKEFNGHNLIKVESIKESHKFKSGAAGFSKILDLASQNQDRNKPFQPFVILEDDASKFDNYPEVINIPKDTDIFYLGLSRVGIKRKKGQKTYKICHKIINEKVIRIYNMLSTHAMIICSIRGLISIQKCMFESWFKKLPWDLRLTHMQPFINVYAMKKPLIYQNSKVGGSEWETKIPELFNKECNLPDEWINDGVLVNKTLYKK